MNSIENNILNPKFDLTFSIIIPTYERPEALSRCLQALTKLQYPQECFEVIVVNDGGQSALTSVTAPFKRRLNLQLLQQANGGPAAARNFGALYARGRFFAFTDDDCTPAPDWLQTLARHFAAEPGCALGGQTLNALPHNPYSSASQLLIHYLYAYYHRRQTAHTQPPFFTTNNMALPADQFRKLNGFNLTLRCAEDRDLCQRWLEAGYNLCYVPEARVYHYHQLTLRTFWQQHFHYGRGNFGFQQLRTRRDQSHANKPEAGSFYLNMARYPFAVVGGRRALVLTSLLILSQAGNVTGYASAWLGQAMRQGFNWNLVREDRCPDSYYS